MGIKFLVAGAGTVSSIRKWLQAMAMATVSSRPVPDELVRNVMRPL